MRICVICGKERKFVLHQKTGTYGKYILGSFELGADDNNLGNQRWAMWVVVIKNLV